MDDFSSEGEQISMVIRDNFVKLIEFNLNKIPLKTLDEYLGSNYDSCGNKKIINNVRKEKYLSFN